MKQASLQTERLDLVPLAPHHLGFLLRLDSDPRVMRYIGYGKPLSESDSAIGLKHLLATAVPNSGLGCWIGFAGENFVGWWVLAPNETEDKPPRLDTERIVYGVRILPRFWGQGLAKEGSLELLRHGFEELGVKEVSGDAMAINTGSRLTMQACGLEYIRTFHNQYENPPAGFEEGEVEYRITKDGWFSKN